MNYDLEYKISNEDIVDAPSQATKKDIVLERLNKRNKDRQNYLDVKVEQRNKENLHLEGTDYFAHTFADRARDIETRIQNINEATTKKSNGDGSSTDLSRLFSEIMLEIQELQRYLTTSTMFLTEFKIKTCQHILNELNVSFDEARSKLIPKKKFGFIGKKNSIKSPLNAKGTITDITLNAGINIDSNDSKSKGFLWTLSNRNNDHIILKGDEVNDKDITISTVSNCFIELQGHIGSVQISNAVNCTILCGPITRSLFAEKCENSTLAVACQQLRLHLSSSCRIYLLVTSRAIIEDCKDIEVASYYYDYTTIDNDFLVAGLNTAQNNYADVADFNWLSPDVPSPNWKLLKDCNEPNWKEKIQEFQTKSSKNNSC